MTAPTAAPVTAPNRWPDNPNWHQTTAAGHLDATPPVRTPRRPRPRPMRMPRPGPAVTRVWPWLAVTAAITLIIATAALTT